jgi:LacI family transcriptional regulator
VNDGTPTLRQIAKRLGVSHVSVSRALRGAPGVSQELAERIRRVASDLGYRDNPLVAAWLKNVRKKGSATMPVVAFLNCRPSEEAASVAFIQEALSGAQRAAEETGFTFSSMHLSELSPGNPARTLKARGVSGIILPGGGYGASVPGIDWSQFAVVVLGYGFRELEVDRVVGDNYGTMQRIMGVLRERGVRRPALFVDYEWDRRLNHLPSAAFAQAMIQEQDLSGVFFARRGQKDDAESWWRQLKADALITHSNVYAEWLVGLAPSFGFKPPLVVQFDRSPPVWGALRVTRNYRLLGKTAMEHLGSLLIANVRGRREHPSVWTIRDLLEWKD